MKEVGLSIKLSESLRDEFSKKCEENMQSQSSVIRRLIEQYIKDGMKIFK